MYFVICFISIFILPIATAYVSSFSQTPFESSSICISPIYFRSLRFHCIILDTILTISINYPSPFFQLVALPSIHITIINNFFVTCSSLFPFTVSPILPPIHSPGHLHCFLHSLTSPVNLLWVIPRASPPTPAPLTHRAAHNLPSHMQAYCSSWKNVQQFIPYIFGNLPSSLQFFVHLNLFSSEHLEALNYQVSPHYSSFAFLFIRQIHPAGLVIKKKKSHIGKKQVTIIERTEKERKERKQNKTKKKEDKEIVQHTEEFHQKKK